MATRRARVKMVPNFGAGNRGRARPGKINEMALDKTDCNDNKSVNGDTEKLNEVKANVIDNACDQGKNVGVMKENGALTRSRSRSSESEKINDQEKILDAGSLTRSRSRSNEKDKTKENVEPSKTAAVAKPEASKRLDNLKTNFTQIVTKPQAESKEKINEQNPYKDSHTNPAKDLKINPPTDSPENAPISHLNDNFNTPKASLNQVKPLDGPIPAEQTIVESNRINSTCPPDISSSSPIDSPQIATKTEPNVTLDPPTLAPNNADLKQASLASNIPTRPLPPVPSLASNIPARPLPPARFKQKFKPNLCGTDSRVRRARKISGGDRRTRALSGEECSPGRQRTTSTGSGSGAEDEAVPAAVQPPPPAAVQPPPPAAVQPPPPVEREVVDNDGIPSTPLLISRRTSQEESIKSEGSLRRKSLEGSSKQGKDELVVCRTESRTRKLTGPKQPEKSHNQLLRRKQDHKRKFQSGIPERQRMTMFDLIYYNPEHGKRMSTDEPEANADDIIEMEAEEVVKNVPDEPVQVANVQEEDVNETPVDEDNAMPVPQVKVGPNGEIILDEASTIVETTQAKNAKEVLQNSPLVFENCNRATNYGTWSKKRKHSDWSNKETLKFYRALSVVGTDFSMMASLFSSKTRQELKLKFKKEEKINGAMIDRCLKQQGQYTDLQEFDEDSEEDDEPPIVQKRARHKSKPKKLRAGTRRITKNRGYYSSSDAEDDNESSVGSPAKPSSRFLHASPAGICQRAATQPSLQRAATQPSLAPRPHTISVVRANSDVGGDQAPRRAASPLLQNLLSRPQPEGGSAPQFPPGLLAANPGLSGVKPGSLVVVASPSKTDPSSQLLHVYMVSPKNRVASPSKALDEVINTNSGLVRARPNMSPRPASRSPSPLSRPPPSLAPSTASSPTPSRKRTLSESSASSTSPTRKRTLSGTLEPGSSQLVQSEDFTSGSSTSHLVQPEDFTSHLPVAKKSKPPDGSSLDENT